MRKVLILALCFACVLVTPLVVPAASTYSSGSVNSRDGEPDRDLKFEDFQITEDGFISGTIVNASSRPRPGVKIDMWTTNPQETRIFWRKSLNIGDMAPNGKFHVKERYPDQNEEPRRTKFMFRLPTDANFRNKTN